MQNEQGTPKAKSRPLFALNVIYAKLICIDANLEIATHIIKGVKNASHNGRCVCVSGNGTFVT